MAYEPYFLKEEATAGHETAASLTITTAEPLMLAPVGSAVAAPAGYRLQLVPPDAHVTVNADVLRLSGSFQHSGCEFFVAARLVELTGDVTIDVSGKAGDPPAHPELKMEPRAHSGSEGSYTYNFLLRDPYTPPIAGSPGGPGNAGANGHDGLAGGMIDIRCQVMHGDKLSLIASGGAGGAGQQGQPGQDGGNGGKGAPYWSGAIADEEMPTPGADAGAGGLGGRGGQGGWGGNGGNVRVYCMTKLPVGSTQSCAAGAMGSTPEEAESGKDGCPGAGGTGGTVHKKGWPYIVPDAKPGGIGKPLERAPAIQPPRTSPTEGTVTWVEGAPASAIAIAVANDPLKAVLQGTLRDMLLDIMLEKARMDTLRLNHSDTANVDDLLARLNFLISVGGAAIDDKGSAPGGIRDGANALKDSITRIDIDYFGNTPTWVPLASLRVYDDLLGGSPGHPGYLDLLKTAEDDWAEFQKAAVDSDEQRVRLASALSTAKTQETALEQQAEAARAKLGKLTGALAQLTAEVHAAKSDLLVKADSFKANVSKTFTIDFTKFLDVIEQTAFAASDPAHAAVVAGSELSKMFTTAATQVTGADGEGYRKNYVIHRMDKYGSDLKNLDEAYKVVNGYVQLKDPDGCKLLCKQDDLDDLLDNFKSVKGASTAKDAMDAYVRKVLARNDQVLDYNDTLTQLDHLNGEIGQVKRRIGKLGAQQGGITPSLLGNLVHGVYQQAKRECIRTLYMASRAYRCWSLRHYDVFKDVLGCDGPADVTYRTALLGRQAILQNNVADLEKMCDDLGARAEPVVVEFDTTERPEIVQALKKERGQDALFNDKAHYWEFDLEPATSASADGDNQFNDMMDVRLVEVRCWLTGMAASDRNGNVKVHLTNTGNERIVPRDGTLPVHVDHDPVEKTFEYRRGAQVPALGAAVTRTDYWGEHPPGKLPVHTPLGPFATWRIGLRTQDFTGVIDWENLKTVRLEFFVRYVGVDTH